ncbi:MAG: hypothetical protein ACRDY4_07675 [Acidimicrobiia bacterium]
MCERVRRGNAFGLGLEVGFECPGLPPPPTGDRDTRPPVRLELARPADLPANGGRGASVDYLLEADGYGTFLVPADGASVLCSPADAAPWQWQRYLVGQILPLVAVLHGFEAFHASVIALGRGAVAFVGRSGAGKSSIAAALVARGAGFVADDVLVVGTDDDPIRAYPGFGLTSLHRDVLALLPGGTTEWLGPQVGADQHGVRIAVDVVPGALPLTAVYFLGRATRSDGSLIERIDPVDPRVVLAGSYNLLVRTVERRIRHLDVCARLARDVECFRIAIAPGSGPTDVAAAVEAHTAADAMRP